MHGSEGINGKCGEGFYKCSEDVEVEEFGELVVVEEAGRGGERLQGSSLVKCKRMMWTQCARRPACYK